MKILIITTLSTLYMICSITSSNTQVVWKSDGTVIDEDGNLFYEIHIESTVSDIPTLYKA